MHEREVKIMAELTYVAWAFRCDECGHARRLKNEYDDPSTGSGACPACGGRRWHIYAKTSDGTVHRIGWHDSVGFWVSKKELNAHARFSESPHPLPRDSSFQVADARKEGEDHG